MHHRDSLSERTSRRAGREWRHTAPPSIRKSSTNNAGRGLAAKDRQECAGRSGVIEGLPHISRRTTIDDTLLVVLVQHDAWLYLFFFAAGGSGVAGLAFNSTKITSKGLSLRFSTACFVPAVQLTWPAFEWLS